VAEYVLAIPQQQVHRRSESKRLALRAVRPLLPDGIAGRLGKREPIRLFERGFRDQGLPVVRELLADPRMASRGYVEIPRLEADFEGFLNGEPVRHDFWWPLTLEMWLHSHWG
jgi:hypothetical protein